MIRTLLLLFFPLALFAMNGAAEIGVGAKSKGMGGVGIALPQDAFASAFNPAGLVCLGCRADLGCGYTNRVGKRTNFNFNTEEFNTLVSNSPGLWFPEGGIVLSVGCNQAFGLATYVKGGLETLYKGSELYFNASQGVPGRFSSYSIFVTPSWSWRANHCLSFGIAINGIIQLHRNNTNYGNRSVSPNLPDGRYAGAGKLDSSGGANLRFGILLTPLSCLRLGLTYQTRPLMSRLKEYSGQWPRQAYWDWPAEIGIGVAYSLRCFLFSADWSYVCWKETSIYGNRFFDAKGRAGTSQGPGFGWQNQSIWKLGAAWDTPLCGLTLRAGYNFGSSPVMLQEVYLNALTLATVESHLTAGASYCFCLGEVSAYYYHGFRSDVNGQGPNFRSSVVSTDLTSHEDGFGVSFGRSW